MIGLLVAVLAILVSILIGTRVSDASLTPKLALDQEGGTQLILTPRSGGSSVPMGASACCNAAASVTSQASTVTCAPCSRSD